MPLHFARLAGATALTAALVAVSALPANAAEDAWDAPVDVSAVADFANVPKVVTDGTTTTAVWTYVDGGNNLIQTASSTDAGLTWSTPVTLSDPTGEAFDPQIVTGGGIITVAWEWSSDFSDYDIQATSSSDGGLTWSTRTDLSDTEEDSTDVQLVTNGDLITAIWMQSRAGGADGVYASSSANGVTWFPSVELSDDATDALEPQLAMSGSVVVAVWNMDGASIQVAYLDSSGSSAWVLPAVDVYTGGPPASNPQILISGTTVTVLFVTDDFTDRLVQSVFSVDGAAASSPRTLSLPGEDVYDPQFVTDGTRITAIWARESGSDSLVQSAFSLDGGSTWSSPVDLSTANRYAGYPQLVTGGGLITAVWQSYDDVTEEQVVQVAQSTDGGVTWSDPITLSDSAVDAQRPELATDGTTITVLWAQRADGAVQASSFTAIDEPELAATGPAENTMMLGGLALLLVVVGATAVARQRRTAVE